MSSRCDRGVAAVGRIAIRVFHSSRARWFGAAGIAVLVIVGVHPSEAGGAPGDVRVGAAAAPKPLLRVCADPNNLPFSNRAGAGYENAIADLVARDLGDSLVYNWWPQRRAWVRNTLNAHKCDLAISVPAGYGLVLTTHPYYRSTYVFVTRADRHYDLASLDDPRLRRLRIGLHFIGTDYDNPPPAHALGDRGIVRNVVAFSIYGNYAQPNPPARLIDAVARESVDVAIVWGPLAGYFAQRAAEPLSVTPVEPSVDPRTGIAFTFAIAMGVRKDDVTLRDALQRVLDRDGVRIHRILASFGVPLLDGAARAN